jgi:hypothetical protein
MKTRTEITVETREVVIIAGSSSLVHGWCARCGAEAGMVRLEEAALTAGALQAIARRVEAGTLHLVEMAGGLSFICLTSLMK